MSTLSFRFTFNEMVVAMVNSPMQTSHSVGCKTQDSAEQDTINDVSLNSPIPKFYFF
jgi:hypothetical protein